MVLASNFLASGEIRIAPAPKRPHIARELKTISHNKDKHKIGGENTHLALASLHTTQELELFRAQTSFFSFHFENKEGEKTIKQQQTGASQLN